MWKRGAAGLAVLASLLAAAAPAAAGSGGYTRTFLSEQCGELSDSGTNPFFVLEPGYRLVLQGKEDGETVQLVVTVLDETLTVDGHLTRIVEERETVDGELAEVSRNFFAICEKNNSVFYFGEDVDNYRNGQVVNHNGSWRAGEEGATAGLIMPGIALLGARYFQEIAPKVAMDRAEIVSLSATVETPAGTFENCLKTRETTPLEPGVAELKFYASGIGLIRDASLRLVEHGFLPGTRGLRRAAP